MFMWGLAHPLPLGRSVILIPRLKHITLGALRRHVSLRNAAGLTKHSSMFRYSRPASSAAHRVQSNGKLKEKVLMTYCTSVPYVNLSLLLIMNA
jgi:hypothetical protein